MSELLKAFWNLLKDPYITLGIILVLVLVLYASDNIKIIFGDSKNENKK